MSRRDKPSREIVDWVHLARARVVAPDDHSDPFEAPPTRSELRRARRDRRDPGHYGPDLGTPLGKHGRRVTARERKAWHRANWRRAWREQRAWDGLDSDGRLRSDGLVYSWDDR